MSIGIANHTVHSANLLGVLLLIAPAVLPLAGMPGQAMPDLPQKKELPVQRLPKIGPSAEFYFGPDSFHIIGNAKREGDDTYHVYTLDGTDTPITERVSSQLRIEIYNLFNRVNLATPTFLGANLFFGTSVSPIGSMLGTSFGLPGIGPGEPANVQVAFRLRF